MAVVARKSMAAEAVATLQAAAVSCDFSLPGCDDGRLLPLARPVVVTDAVFDIPSDDMSLALATAAAAAAAACCCCSLICRRRFLDHSSWQSWNFGNSGKGILKNKFQ
jgi:hypothetical protein